jgi:hypothetical protein
LEDWQLAVFKPGTAAASVDSSSAFKANKQVPLEERHLPLRG